MSTGTRDAMDRMSHPTRDRPRTAAATPHPRQDHAATPLRERHGRRALDTIVNRLHGRTHTRRRVQDGSIGAAKRETTSCGAPGIRTAGRVMSSITSCRCAPVVRMRRATCNGRPLRKGRQRTGRNAPRARPADTDLVVVRTSLALALALTLTGCRFLGPPDQLDHDARQLFSYVRSDRLESARAMLQAKVPMDTLNKYLAMARDFIRPFPPDSFTLIGWNVVYMADTTGELTYEAKGGGRTALFSVAVRRHGGAPEITAFNWEPTTQPLAAANALTLSGKTPTHYLYLSLAILAFLACVTGAVFAGVQRLGVPWILASLIGLGSFSINWTTGATGFSIVSFHILGAGYVRSGTVAPWVVTWSIPLGTILMWIVWWQRRRRARAAVPTPDPLV